MLRSATESVILLWSIYEQLLASSYSLITPNNSKANVKTSKPRERPKSSFYLQVPIFSSFLLYKGREALWKAWSRQQPEANEENVCTVRDRNALMRQGWKD